MTEAKNLATAGRGATGKGRRGAPEAFVEVLAAHQVKDVFGIIGSPRLDAFDLLPGADIRLVNVAQQQAAAHMADGYGRASQRPAVCIAPDGPGLINVLPAVTAAYWARSPMVVVTPSLAGVGHNGFFEAGHAPIFSRITRWQAQVSSPAQLADLMHRAFTIALHERGPVLVGVSDESFRGESDYEIRSPLVIEPAAGGVRALARAAQLLAEAKSPVIVAGEGLALADGVDEVRALAEQLTAPVVSTFRHNDTFPANHPLACGPLGTYGSKAAMRMLARADVVLVLGTRLGDFGVTPRQDGESWREDAKVIQIDSDERTLGAASEVALAIHGDARLVARELLGYFKGRAARKPDKARLAEVQREKESWIAELASLPSLNRKGQIGARRALAQLAKALPRNVMVSTDVGAVCSVASSYLAFDQPGSFFAALGEGGRGCAYPTALGAKLARPERPAIAYVGEGAWGISLAEVMTAVKEKIPAIAVVFNNGHWGAERRGPVDVPAGRAAADAATPDFSEVARAMGAEGYRAEYEDEVADALKAALKSGKPAVVEIMVTPERGEIFGREGARKTRRPSSQQRETVAAD